MTTVHHGTLEIPEAPHQLPVTPREDIDKAIAELQAQKDAWAATGIHARMLLLEQLLRDTVAVAEEWAERDNAVKRLPPGSREAAEGWTNGPWIVLRGVRLLLDALRDTAQHGRPQLPGPITTRPGGQVVVPVFPRDVAERLIFPGWEAAVWMEPGVTPEDVERDIARVYRAGEPRVGRVGLVLGAGNVSAIPGMDAISKIFLEDQAVVLKMNPVNEHVGPVYERALRALIDRDVLRIVYGGAAEGRYLTDHDGVEAIHMTGSDKTFEAIVFGAGEEGARRKAAGERRLDKEITAELGNVTPIIVVPGPWSDRDVDYQGENIASSLANNDGFNCISGRVVVTHRAWSRRRPLLDAVRRYLGEAPRRYAYYPGAEDRWRRFVDAHPDAELIGTSGDGCLPWTFIPGLDPDAEDEIAFHTEAFAPVVGEVPLDAPRSLPDFIDAAVRFCNERLWGTLGATILVHPRSLADPQVAAALDRAVADLRYGTVSVNVWVGLAYPLGVTPWGAFPGHDITDIQSGVGKVHNFLMLDRPQKAVFRAPFRAPVRMPWFVTHRGGAQVGRRMALYAADPSPAKLPAILWSFVRA